MTIHTASRTLLKSPPELWAECSEAQSLHRHLDKFGEIKITRLEPETTVAWEGERASGTVRLEPSGWGTRVILTAEECEMPGVSGGPPRAPEVVPSSPAVVEPDVPVAGESAPEEPATEQPAAEQPAVKEPAAEEPAAEQPAPEQPAVKEPAPEEPTRPVGRFDPTPGEPALEPGRPATAPQPEPRKGLFARLLARMRAPAAVPVQPPAPNPSAPKVVPVAPEPRATAKIGTAPSPAVRRVYTAASPEGPRADAGPAPSVRPRDAAPSTSVSPRDFAASTSVRPRDAAPEPDAGPEPAEGPKPDAQPDPAKSPEAVATETALTDALDSLGMAHHRPFSRA